MKIEIAKYERMSERGSSLLRLIQNHETPLLDLFVRESVQNSLDAGLPGHGFVDVKFRTGTFSSQHLVPILEGIRNSFFSRHQDNNPAFLSITDSNTHGLTGPLHYYDVKDGNYGNLLKLVYEINMPQSQEGAGGSWGLGKTVYFRLGIGLVFYYSRIKLDTGEYQHRLAASLVEDESSEDALLEYPFEDQNLKRGIAWWGRPRSGGTEPLTDEAEIRHILDVFNIPLFENSETGTTIIIPYIDEEKLLNGIVPRELAEANNLPFWHSSIQKYLDISVQRWYAPRLANDNYKFGRWLRCTINGKGIARENFYPLFSLIQNLYNTSEVVRTPESALFDIINKEDISLRNEFIKGGRAGQIIYVKADRSILKMTPPDNYPDPFKQLNLLDLGGDLNPPIIAYTRQPGMIVNYETTGAWTDGIPKTNDGEFIIGLFVLNSENVLKDTKPAMSLEQYIRKGEKADHTSWNDWNVDSRLTIVSKITKWASSKISHKYQKSDPIPSRKNIGLGKALADSLLPPEGFGRQGTVRSNLPTPPTGKKRKLNLSITDHPRYYHENQIRHAEIPFEISWTSKTPDFLLSVVIKTESTDIHADQWESKSEFNTPFPVVLKEVKITDLKIGTKRFDLNNSDFSLSEKRPSAIQNDIVADMIRSESFKTPTGAEFLISDLSKGLMSGTLTISIHDDSLVPGIMLNQITGEQ